MAFIYKKLLILFYFILLIYYHPLPMVKLWLSNFNPARNNFQLTLLSFFSWCKINLIVGLFLSIFVADTQLFLPASN